ncbi:uncharacterized protein LOC107492861 [Arachis duranensis]|uniref:Uncharacterized protein LOC107492861 n=1 Tax=Arachis duranensis TaxID=130453 RepID=A0A6P4DJQ3_ARADU|nr:uncharacterized protein LOC107492861 [Arachis duranensis]
MPPLADCRFFRFIIPNMENQFRLPVAFSNVVRDNMSNPVQVITTNGQSWSISWFVEEEHPHQVVFTGGWRAFYEHYHLQIGDSMLLSYHQPKFFCAAIHDTTYFEINYGRNLRNGSLPAIPAHGNYAVQFFAIIPVNDPDTLNTMYVMFFNGHTMEINYLAHAGPGTDSTCITDPSAPRSRHIGDGFRSTNPFFVIPIMHRLANHFLPNVPPLPGVCEDSPITITNDRGAWTVRFTHYVGRTNGCFGIGWSALATACQLRHGHVCVFERLAPQEYRLHVY